MSTKRASSPVSALIKRARTAEEDDPLVQSMVVASSADKASKGALIQSVRRTSGLNAPIMSLNVSQLTRLGCKAGRATVADGGFDWFRVTLARSSTSSSQPMVTHSPAQG